jgi:hypothetical protein
MKLWESFISALKKREKGGRWVTSQPVFFFQPERKG